jgi:hypothetical protein
VTKAKLTYLLVIASMFAYLLACHWPIGMGDGGGLHFR